MLHNPLFFYVNFNDKDKEPCLQKSIKFFVADNGCGFDYNNVCKNTKGQGLSMIRDRLYIFNGSVKVTKNNDKGIKFYIDIPLEYKEK